MKRDTTPEKTPGHKPCEWDFLDNLAYRLGFSAIGVIPAGPLPAEVSQRYRRWVSSGYNADMTYMTKNEAVRRNTAHENLFENANAIIIAAMPYGQGAVREGVWHYVARHARGRDYHKTVKHRLKLVAEVVSHHFPNLRYRLFSDSAPIMERSLALLAGLGTIGKNGALIVKDVGPRVLLGEIICSGVPTPPNPPPPRPLFSLCHSCRQCMDMCPTGAIVAPGMVDARACLSYWTIERSLPVLPSRISSGMTKIFGCDICTSVCPHTSEQPSRLEPPTSKEPLPRTLSELVKTDDDQLKEALKGTAMLRTGVQMIKRNAHHILEKETRRR